MTRVILAALMALTLVRCEDKNDDKIYSAQTCLDHSTPATVDTCVAMVAGISTGQANIIRCSADFIRENITTSTIVTAIENLDKTEGNNGNDPNVELYDVFAFDGGANSSENLSLVNAAVSNCESTGSETLTVLALSAKTATVLKNLAGGGSIQSWLDGLDQNDIDDLQNSNPEELAAIGQTVLQLRPIACDKNGQFEGTEVCTNIDNAVTDGQTPEQIAQQFLAQLKNSN